MFALRTVHEASSPFVWWQLAPAALSAVAALSSLAVALMVHRSQRSWHISDTLMAVVTRLEEPSCRGYRDTVYHLRERRLSFADWTLEERAAVDSWGAELDVVSLLLMADQVDMSMFLALYGDVALRSIYIIAPYANSQRQIRGEQFLIPARRVTAQLVTAWRRSSKSGKYPASIAFKYGGGQLDIKAFASDSDIRAFMISVS
jgi:hypothetical protein